jgi:trigger factor
VWRSWRFIHAYWGEPMQTQLLEKEAVRAKFSVSVPATEVDRAFDKTLRTLARQVKVPGFRPGKAPRGVLLKRIGEDALAQEVRDELLETYYPQALRELKLTPLHAHFQAHEPKEGEDYRFEVEVELLPEVTLPPLDEIVIDSEVPPLTEAMVEASIERLRFDHATLIPVERPAQAGDVVTIETLDKESGTPTGSTMPIDLERVSPELGDQLVGRSIGDELELVLGPSAAGDEGDESEGGEPTRIKVIVRDVQEREKPEPGDEFAKTLGFDSWDEVDAQVRKSIEVQLEREGFAAQREEFIDKLVAQSTLELPKVLIENRKRQLLGNLQRELDERGHTLKAYMRDLEHKGEREAFERELQEAAERDVRRDLVLEKLVELRGTTLSDDVFNEALQQLAAQQRVEVARLKRELGEVGLKNYRFLLTRNKAVREALHERLAQQRAAGEGDKGDKGEVPTASEEASAG